ncbi:Plastidic type i signal peptidase 1 isoform 2 [Hibiscus syriacus]|uniref:Plastidic type i signal peptidase 1 isoform 2 n=1 Tax=Hibiscus syriacus TaxID=106335 RepID=A0A6A2ZQM9_HIBSY|nr:Plastidic type i signal peptidase 1 isoform 2 [Hibiscus syriacus]
MVLRPRALDKSLITFPSLKWMPCQSWGFLRWPGIGGFFRFLVIALLWTTFSEIHFILSSSMYPTLHVGDQIIVEKVHHGSLYVNGVEQQENFIAERPSYTSDLKYVPNGHVYVGDNRNNSYNSHN